MGALVALVTGAAQGLGAAIARRLHEDGFRVALGDLNSPEAERVAAELDPAGETARAFGLDVADADSIEAAFARVTEVWGQPDVLVNNAGVTVKRSLWEITVDEWDAVLDTNLRSYFVLSRLAAAGMRDRGWGRIVNVSSFAGQQGGLVAGAHYAASKAGILVLTKIFARELAGDGVTVNAITPAAVRTPAMDDDEVTRLGAGIPVGRVGQPQEIAAAVAYLVGPDSGYVTGATLDLNGGLFMR
ncbi:SDR family NAD(P)-dependent oxidoreductase [Amycolatopsis magusensis]|uniref:3-oxoacyl-[acyl-carrier protein] reductase n=1 Tax=Amycolatopsis magusensis TaxID=882444 RepID=A0ABS4PYT3_9PSEU|nr:SDR family NAD(P)-dependent oxidoreductase [Amycolatopsis magusensis]MBP2184468.1 3-oxoacyl-[acyl-carrier protein] reductase [Amycolatopsis magusensis]